MIEIRHLSLIDKENWFKLDKHLPENEFINKINLKQGYLLLDDNNLIGILRYNLFWDEIPFLNLIYIDEKYQNHGYGKILLSYWEKDMKNRGYNFLLTSTQASEKSQHFYRKLGYQDCGNLLIKNESMEIFLSKDL